MADVKWIKITTSMFSDEKIRLIESMPDKDTILIIWIKLLIQAGRTNANGYIYLNPAIPYTDEMLSTIFGRPLTTVRMALKVFQDFEMIEIDDKGIYISNWQKYQNVDGMDKIREQTRQRVAKFRESQKKVTDGNVTVTQGNALDIDKDIDKEKEKEIYKEKERTHIFTPPKLDDVKAYCQERSNHVDPEKFVDFYASKGWMVGKNKMKDWKAAVRTWEKDDKARPQQSKAANKGNFDQRRYTDQDIEKFYKV